MDYDYKLICAPTCTGLTEKVKQAVEQGYKPMGPHTHQKSTHTDVPEQQTWNNMFCISMEKLNSV